MPNTVLTPSVIANETLRLIHQKCNFVGTIDRQYDDSFAKKGGNIGNALRIRKPVQFVSRSGRNLAMQDIVEEDVTLNITEQDGIDFGFYSDELTLSVDEFSTRYLQKAAAKLASVVETKAMAMRQDVYQQVNGMATTLSLNSILDAKVLLDNSLTPEEGRIANMRPIDMVNVVKDTKTLFNNQTSIGEQYKKGYVGMAAGYEFMQNTNWAAQARGAGTGYIVNGAGQTGASLVVSTGTGAINKGEVFTIAGVNAIHPETKQDLGYLQQFVVTTTHAGGAGTLAISPSIVATGARQTVSASPANSAVITLSGTASTAYGCGLVYHKEAFTFATADLIMPDDGTWGARRVLDGISLRVVRQYDINTDRMPCRFDILYGWKTLQPSFAARTAALAA